LKKRRSRVTCNTSAVVPHPLRADPHDMILTRGTLNSFLFISLAFSLSVYLYNRLTIDGASNVQRARNPLKYGFPEWYGRPGAAAAEGGDDDVLGGRRVLVLTSESHLVQNRRSRSSRVNSSHSDLTEISAAQLSFLEYLATAGSAIKVQAASIHANGQLGGLIDLPDWCEWDAVWTVGGGEAVCHCRTCMSPSSRPQSC
jgi:hypothetical protein